MTGDGPHTDEGGFQFSISADSVNQSCDPAEREYYSPGVNAQRLYILQTRNDCYHYGEVCLMSASNSAIGVNESCFCKSCYVIARSKLCSRRYLP